MPDVYVVQSGGRTEAMTFFPAKDESKDLQELLEHNFNLLPGEQIDPDAPSRWVLVKREMPVPDTVTGAPRWNIDFLFVDQLATPTFVECKRYADTRARREVIGQVLEYVANAKHFWTADDMRSHAVTTAKSPSALEDLVRQLQPEFMDVAAFFGEAERKLKAGDVRIVFFMEQAPDELKRLVEFMNLHMDTVEVLLVEARQYVNGTTKVIIPTLFGFTERIREIKRATAAASQLGTRQAVASDWESFRANAKQQGMDDQQIEAMRRVHEACVTLGADVRWGRGTVMGSFSPRWSVVARNAAPFSIHADGAVGLHFPALNSEVGKAFSVKFAQELSLRHVALPDDVQTQWPNLQAADWVPHVDAVIEALQISINEAIKLTGRAQAV